MESPRHYYSNINFGFRMFMLITKLVPTSYGDRMILQMWGDHVGYNLDRNLCEIWINWYLDAYLGNQ